MRIVVAGEDRVRLSEVVAGVSGVQITEAEDIEITDMTYDSRRVQPGFLFVAVPTVGGDANSGGYQHIEDAAARGAAAVIAEQGLAGLNIPLIQVPNTRAALADLADAFFQHPSRDLRVYAVTGTDGKTTTTYLLEQIFAVAGRATGLIGTVELKIGDQRAHNAGRMTTPESLDLQRLLREMAALGVTDVALEASSHAIALERLKACRFAGAALTNITADHLEFHGSWDEYFRVKASLFSGLAADAPAILNADDPSFDRLLSLANGQVVAYGRSATVDLRADEITSTSRSVDFSLSWEGESQPVTLHIPGAFNVANALAAAGLALTAGLPLVVVAEALSAAIPPPGRMEHINVGQAFDVVVDYAHTTHAFRAALSSARHATPGRLIAVFGAAGDRDRYKRPQLAEIAREYADYFFITNEDPFGEDPLAIIEEIAAGLPEAEYGKRYEREPDRGRAIESALEMARAGDAVVILGKGHEQSIVANGRKEPWSDVETVKQVLGACV